MLNIPDALKIRVIGFRNSYERVPIKGDPLNDTIDDRGFKLDGNGRRIMDKVAVHRVIYSPAHSPLNTAIEERVKHIQVTPEMLEGEETQKLTLMKLRWEQIAPEYDAWLTGNTAPTKGVPLSAWAGVTAEMAEILRRFTIASVEGIASLSEGQMEKIPLPDMRGLRNHARIYLESREAADIAQREADREEKIAALEIALAEQREASIEQKLRLESAMKLLEDRAASDQSAASPGPADEVSRLKAELDRLGVGYHPRHGLEKLRSLLDEAQQSQAA